MKLVDFVSWLIPGWAPLRLRPSFSLWMASLIVPIQLYTALALTILWREAIPHHYSLALWASVAGSWTLGVILSWRFVREEEARRRERASQDVFPEALHAYLRGDRARAESLLSRQLRADPHDVEAALLLASVWRRQGRKEAARTLLRNLAKLEAAWPWEFEIRRELEALEREVVQPAAGGSANKLEMENIPDNAPGGGGYPAVDIDAESAAHAPAEETTVRGDAPAQIVTYPSVTETRGRESHPGLTGNVAKKAA